MFPAFATMIFLRLLPVPGVRMSTPLVGSSGAKMQYATLQGTSRLQRDTLGTVMVHLLMAVTRQNMARTTSVSQINVDWSLTRHT